MKMKILPAQASPIRTDLHIHQNPAHLYRWKKDFALHFTRTILRHPPFSTPYSPKKPVPSRGIVPSARSQPYFSLHRKAKTLYKASPAGQ